MQLAVSRMRHPLITIPCFGGNAAEAGMVKALFAVSTLGRGIILERLGIGMGTMPPGAVLFGAFAEMVGIQNWFFASFILLAGICL